MVTLVAHMPADKTIKKTETFISCADVSEHQGLIDWEKFSKSGIKMVYIRYSNGTRVDKYAHRNAGECRRLNIKFGLYCYWHPMFFAIRQAKLLAAATRNLGASLVPMLDIEAHDNQRPIAIVNKLGRSVELLTKRFNKPPIIYTGAWFWNVRVKSGLFSHCPLWVAQYVHYSRKAFKNPSHAIPLDPSRWDEYANSHDNPVAVVGWSKHSAWQFAGGYNGMGRHYGMKSLDMDTNIIKGSELYRFQL